MAERLLEIGHSLMGLVCLIAVAWIFSRHRRAIDWRSVAVGLVLQILIAAILLKIPAVQTLFLWVNAGVDAMVAATGKGTAFVFGYIGGSPAPFDVTHPQNSFILAFQSLPLILVYGAVAAVLYHYGIIQRVVRALSWLLRRTLRIGGAAGIASAANVFVGMVEAPLFIRPWVARLSSADLFLVMTAGMATIAGNMLVLYATFLKPILADPVAHLLTASLISAPAAVVIAKIMVPADPHTGAKDPEDEDAAPPPPETTGGFDAMVSGALAGVQLVINIIAMLIVMIALVTLINKVLGLFPDAFDAPLTLQRMIGWCLTPLAWAMGLSWHEAVTVGPMLGTKVVLNELLAYLDLAGAAGQTLSPRSQIIMTYALCSFANFGSLGIMVGGMVAMAPTRRAEIVRMGGWTLLSGTLATLMTGAVVGLLV